MKIEELYDFELKYQEVYKRTKDYTRNDFVIELIKKDDEKQELIEYLKEEIEQLENLPKDEEMTLEAHGRLNAYRIILSKIEKSSK